MLSRLRLAERIGRALGFSPEGRAVRVWVKSRPGEEDAVVVGGTVLEVSARGALLELDEPVEGVRRVEAVAMEPGWGLDALWFGFVAVDAFPIHAPDGAPPLGRWWLRLGRPG